MATVVKRRLVARPKHLIYGLLHDPIDHVRYAKSPLCAAALRYPHAPDVSDPVAPVHQPTRERRQDLPEVLSYLVDRLPVRSRGAVVPRYSLERPSQVFLSRHLLHRHRGLAPSFRGLRLRHRARSRDGLACLPCAVGPSRAVGCLEVQFRLPRLFSGRGPFPSPHLSRGLDRLSTAFRYSGTIRLLSSFRHLVLSFSTTTASKLESGGPRGLPG